MADNIRYISLCIPNEEVRYIYKNTVLMWFEQKVGKKDLTSFYRSIVQGNVPEFENTLSEMLREGIRFYDTKEAFYHGFIMGLLNSMEDYYAYSNRESGDGRYDICLKSVEVHKPVVIIELKIALDYHEMEAKSKQAVDQIMMKHYGDDLARDGYKKALCYGIAFYKKNCRISLKEKKIG